MRTSHIVMVCLGLLVAAGTDRQRLWGDDTLEQRRTRLEKMTDSEKTALLEKKRRFDGLLPEQRRQMQRLHTDLLSHPECDRLRKVLERYNQWLRTLTPGVRAQILSLPPEQRIARIEEELRKQEPRRFERFVGWRLNREDLHTIGKWLDQFVDDHITEILPALPDRFAEIKQDYDPEKHRRRLAFIVYHLRSSDLPRPTKEDEQQLQKSLSADARKFLEERAAAEKKDTSRILEHWIGGANFSRMRFSFSSEELDKFVAELDERQRERLENLPRDRMYRELQGMYFMHWYRQSFGDMPWSGMGRGGPGSGRGGNGRGGTGRGRGGFSRGRPSVDGKPGDGFPGPRKSGDPK